MVEEKEKTIVEAEDMLKSCRLCPRVCKVNRIEGERGYCGADAQMRIARADLHFWEEPCISAKSGSGAVFFSGCNLRCVFCQNHEIAEQLKGKSFSPLQLAESFLMLEKKGANNINLVTASPYLPQLILAIRQAKEMGLGIPIVYNSSGYENLEAIQLLDGMIDIYLPDFKYMDREMAKAYSNAQDYPDRAKEALAEMVRQTGGAKMQFSEDGIMQKGIIVRHLLMPGHVKNAKAVLAYLYSSYGDDIYVSILQQYTPILSNPRVKEDPLLSRKVTKREYERLLDYAIELGLKKAFIQERGVAKESFIPSWDLT